VTAPDNLDQAQRHVLVLDFDGTVCRWARRARAAHAATMAVVAENLAE
jgi:trehalose-6-phosphatase